MSGYPSAERVEHFLIRSAARYPDKVALIHQKKTITYFELDQQSSQFAHHLLASGLCRGDRVLIFLPNCPESVVAIFGILKAGGVFCPINHGTKSDKLRYIQEDAGARFMITQANLQPATQEVASYCERIYIIDPADNNKLPYLDFNKALEASSDKALEPAGIDTDLAMLIYTSGSTGFPKGVMMMHRNICFATCSINRYLKNSKDEVILLTLPVSFDYGLYQLFFAAQLGATVVLEQGFTFPAAILKVAREYQVTNFPLVPTMAALLLRMTGLSTHDLESLRCITNTGAALPPQHIQQLQTRFPDTAIYSMYGLTECKRCTYLEPDELQQRPDSVGKAIPFTEVFLVDAHHHILGAGETGELVIRGSHVMPGYWNNAEATAQSLRPHPLYPWETVLYSGDLFRMDDEGYLYFIARQDDMIKSRGEKVSPKEVENVLYTLEGVCEAVVIGVPDEILGTIIKAIIVPADGTLLERNVIMHCRSRLEAYMVPQKVEFVEFFKKMDSGKIDRTNLYE